MDHRSTTLRTGLATALIGVVLAWPCEVLAQCGPNVPSFPVDLSSAPNATFLSPSFQRQGLCCGATFPDQCLEFIVTLHPDAQGIVFNVCEGAMPPGALFYQIGCGPQTPVGQPVCLNGPGPHVLTFCKPGNNQNRYCITSVPAPTAGPGIALNDGCTGTITSSGFAPGTIQWTSVFPGAQGAYDGYLACPTCPNTTVTGQPGYPPYVDYQVCGNAVSPCSFNRYCDTVRVWFFSTLTATIVPQEPTVCFGAAGTTITVVGGGGTPPYAYQWSTGATTASIFVGPGTYTVQLSDTSQCPPTTATITVTEFTQPITADAGGDILVCGGSTGPVPLNGSVTGAPGGIWSGGQGQFLPGATTLNGSYTPSAGEIASGSVTLTLTTTGNGTCPGDSDRVTITFADPFPLIAITATDATCAASSDGSVSVSPNTPGWTYTWSNPPGASGPIVTGLPAGTFSVHVRDASGCDTTLTATILAPAPLSTANTRVTNESCAGFGDGSVMVSVNGGTPPYTYTWSNGGTGPSITGGTGTYTVTITDANGCAPVSATATIVALGAPNVAHAGPDITTCLGRYPIPLNGTVTNATGGAWSGGAGTFSGTWPNVLYHPSSGEVQAGGTTLVLTTAGNGSCPAGTDTLRIVISNSFLNASITATDVSCHGGSDGTATFLPAGPGLSFLWSGPGAQTGHTATGLPAGTYQVLVTDALGCDTVMPITIAQPDPLVARIDASANPLCATGSTGSATAGASGGTPGYTWSWAPGGQTSANAIGLGPGTHTVTVTDARGCTAQTSVTLTAPPAVTLVANVPDTVCVNSPVRLSAQAGGGQGGYTITWAGLGTGDSITHSFTATRSVSVTVVDAAGCHGPVLTFIVNVLDLSQARLTAYGDTTVCPGGTARVGAHLSNYPGPYTMEWPQLGAFGSGPFTVPVTGSIHLVVRVTDACQNSLRDSVALRLESPPTIALPPLIAEGCAPLTVRMPDLGLGNGIVYDWDLGNGSRSTAPVPEATYPAGTWTVRLTVRTPLGCSTSANSAGGVIAHRPPTAGFTASPWETNIDNARIAFTDQSTPGIVARAWDFGDGTVSTVRDPVHTYSALGNHPVELWVRDNKGCTDSVTREVRITPVYDVKVPNIFTPDPRGGGGGRWVPNDLNNDVFYPFARFVDDFRMRIFNRWGELVFESRDITHGWDGYYRGQMGPQDVYVYRIWLRFVDGVEAERMGDVTLMR